MFAKVCAAWLVVLVLLPFTAPFSSFDLNDLLAETSQGVDPAHSSTPPAAISGPGLSHAVPLPPRTGRLRVDMTRLRSSSALPGAIEPDADALATSPGGTARASGRPFVLRI